MTDHNKTELELFDAMMGFIHDCVCRHSGASYHRNDFLSKGEQEKIRAALEARLEISEEHGIDGIEARDATIKGQDKTIDALKSENERLREVLERSLIKHKAYVGICEGDKELVTAIIPMIEEALKGDA